MQTSTFPAQAITQYEALVHQMKKADAAQELRIMSERIQAEYDRKQRERLQREIA